MGSHALVKSMVPLMLLFSASSTGLPIDEYQVSSFTGNSEATQTFKQDITATDTFELFVENDSN